MDTLRISVNTFAFPHIALHWFTYVGVPMAFHWHIWTPTTARTLCLEHNMYYPWKLLCTKFEVSIYCSSPVMTDYWWKWTPEGSPLIYMDPVILFSDFLDGILKCPLWTSSLPNFKLIAPTERRWPPEDLRSPRVSAGSVDTG